MDVAEDYAELYETEHSPTLRRHYAERYRKIVGVYPEHRSELREALDRIEAGGGSSVADTIDLINRDHANRSLSAVGETADA